MKRNKIVDLLIWLGENVGRDEDGVSVIMQGLSDRELIAMTALCVGWPKVLFTHLDKSGDPSIYSGTPVIPDQMKARGFTAYNQ